MFTGFRQIPPIAAKGKTLSGMGTPDLRGTYGTFTFYTDDPTAAAGAVEGGEVVQVEVKENRVDTHLIGPDNTFRKTRRLRLSRLRWMWTHWRRGAHRHTGSAACLERGEWSGWHVPDGFS